MTDMKTELAAKTNQIECLLLDSKDQIRLLDDKFVTELSKLQKSQDDQVFSEVASCFLV